MLMPISHDIRKHQFPKYIKHKKIKYKLLSYAKFLLLPRYIIIIAIITDAIITRAMVGSQSPSFWTDARPEPETLYSYGCSSYRYVYVALINCVSAVVFTHLITLVVKSI